MVRWRGPQVGPPAKRLVLLPTVTDPDALWAFCRWCRDQSLQIEFNQSHSGSPHSRCCVWVREVGGPPSRRYIRGRSGRSTSWSHGRFRWGDDV